MNCAKLLVWLVIFLTMAATFPVKQLVAAENSPDITFIASAEELDAALFKEKTLRGLGIRTEFYASSGAEHKKKMESLVRSVSNSLIPIIVYGKSPYVQILTLWFPRLDGYLKEGADAVMIFPTLTPDNMVIGSEEDGESNGFYTIIFRFSNIYAELEKEFREQISASWEIERKALKEEGYATLN